TTFATETLFRDPDASLPELLEAALDRRYSASPWPGFHTGGALHVFHNFDEDDDARIYSVRNAFRLSVNLPFVRLMRDVVEYHMARLPGDPAAMLRDRDDPRRPIWLRRWQEEEARIFLARFHRYNAGKSRDQQLAGWVERTRPTARRYAAAYRSIFPERSFERFAAAMRRLPAAAELGDEDLRIKYRKYASERFSLSDRAFLARMHPLELWLIEWLRAHPDASFDDAVAASGDARDAAYTWLFKTRNRGAQDRRIHTLLEREAFRRIHREWKTLGYPFASLSPSYATAIGSSGDRPSALAELVGIIAADGMRLPSMRVTELRFGEGTPYETAFAPAAKPQRVMRRAVARALRGALLEVVGRGTAGRARGAFVDAGGAPLPLGGKTGTGDHQRKRFDRWANVIDTEYVSRSATLVFFAGDRFHGVVTAHVQGPEAADYAFTSSLPSQVIVTESSSRDGLQSLGAFVPTEDKAALINNLAKAGLRHFDAVSFVNPKAVPQMAVFRGRLYAARNTTDGPQLWGCDPAVAARLNPRDQFRLIRAWEVLEATGRSIDKWQRMTGEPGMAHRRLRLITDILS
ncbi:MAG: hypothetical protein ABFS41_19500, partial [Myxococcota bacterium]